jgi:MtrB/PioB family decaheme-associated outer membrane protein
MRRGRARKQARGVAKLAFALASLLVCVAIPAAGNDADDQLYRELTLQGSSIEAGFIYNDVSGASPFAYGNYRGLIDDQFYFLGNVDLYRRAPWDGDSSQYYRIQGLNLGLTSRYVGAEYGHQGIGGLRIFYDELPVYRTENAYSFFTGSGDSSYVLPPGWVAGGRADTPVPGDPGYPTAFQTSILENSTKREIEWDRRKIGSEFSAVLHPNVEFDADYVYETKKGKKLMAAIIGENGGDPRSVIIPEPLDYITQRFGGALHYGGERLQLGLEYHGSVFDDENHHTTWEVPFTARGAAAPFNPIWDLTAGFQGPPDGVLPECVGVFGCGTGRKGQMPDNWFHQILATGGYDLPYRTRVTLGTAFSWAHQDQDYLPYTVNPELVVDIPLPRNDLDGQVFTTIVDFGITSRPLNKLRLDARYRFEDRDNQTPRDTYVYVTSDAADQGDADGGTARINLPYSLTRNHVTFDVGYQLPLRSELVLGYEWEQTERDYQEVEELWENTLSAILTGRPASSLQTRIHYEHTWRDGSSYEGSRPFIASHTPAFIDEEATACIDDGFTLEECLWENHPLLRKYYLANVHRDSIQSLVTWIPHEVVSISASVGWTLDDYYDTTYGLTGYQSASPGIDVTVAPLEWLSVYGFYNYEWSRYKQKGISFGNPTQAMDPTRDWWSRQSVYTHTAGVGFDVAAIPNRLEFGVDYVYADSTGVIGIDVGSALAAVPNFPNTDSHQNNVSVRTEYHFTDNFSTRVGYLFQDLSTADYALDGITQNSLTCSGNSCVIGAGQDAPDYTAHAVFWSLVFEFW